MKRFGIRLAAMLLGAAVILLAGASIASADEMVVVSVPFEFSVGEVQLPAGRYVITRNTSQPNLLQISTVTGKNSVLTLAATGSASLGTFETPKLAFERVPGGYRLARIILDQASERQILLPAVKTAADLDR